MKKKLYQTTKAERFDLILTLNVFWKPVIVWCNGGENNTGVDFEPPTIDECSIVEIGGE